MKHEKHPATIAGFEVGRRELQTKGCRQPPQVETDPQLTAGRVTSTSSYTAWNSVLPSTGMGFGADPYSKPPERSMALLAADFSVVKPEAETQLSRAVP